MCIKGWIYNRDWPTMFIQQSPCSSVLFLFACLHFYRNPKEIHTSEQIQHIYCNKLLLGINSLLDDTVDTWRANTMRCTREAVTTGSSVFAEFYTWDTGIDGCGAVLTWETNTDAMTYCTVAPERRAAEIITHLNNLSNKWLWLQRAATIIVMWAMPAMKLASVIPLCHRCHRSLLYVCLCHEGRFHS